MDLSKLAEPFPAGAITWRVQSAWPADGKVSCLVIPYITTVAIETRLDTVCGPENWCSTPLECHEVRAGVIALQVGISIRFDGEWITKYDVSEAPAKRETVKGGYTGAFKRAAYKWGLGRTLKNVGAMFATTSKTGGKGWNWAELNDKHGGKEYYWQPPLLPAFALPREADVEAAVTLADINRLKSEWGAKFAPTETDRMARWTAFKQFVDYSFGNVQIDDPACWTQKMISVCRKRITETVDARGPSSDVPFE